MVQAGMVVCWVVQDIYRHGGVSGGAGYLQAWWSVRRCRVQAGMISTGKVVVQGTSRYGGVLGRAGYPQAWWGAGWCRVQAGIVAVQDTYWHSGGAGCAGYLQA